MTKLRRFHDREVLLPTAIVTDSTSDIPPDLLTEFGIYQIPVDLTLENKTYLDGFDLSRNEFYDRLPSLKKLPTTAAPSAGRFQELFERVFKDGYTEIISIHAASKLSGFITGRYAPTQAWKCLWENLLRWLSRSDDIPSLNWTPVVGLQAGPDEPLPDTCEDDAFHRSVTWFRKQGLKKDDDYRFRKYEGADHSERAWRARVGDQLEWLLAE